MKNIQIPRVVIVGHVDHGKSSLIGRLMYDLGHVPKEKFNEIDIQTTFQSRFGPQEWLTPYTDKTLESFLSIVLNTVI